MAYGMDVALRLGCITFCPDAFAFGERYKEIQAYHPFWELGIRINNGSNLLVKILNDVCIGVEAMRKILANDRLIVNFIGHSYGGRLALWASNIIDLTNSVVCCCGAIWYKHSESIDTGTQIEFVVPNIKASYDIDTVISNSNAKLLVLIGGKDDKWCRGLSDIKIDSRIRVKIFDGNHDFSQERKDWMYSMLQGSV